MRKRIVFLTGLPKSHITPIFTFLEYFKSLGVDIYIFGVTKNKEILSNYCNTYIEYPNSFFAMADSKYRKNKLNSFEKYKHEKKYTEAFVEFLKADLSYPLNLDVECLEWLEEQLNVISPNCVCFDSTVRYFYPLTEKYKNIGYVTNNIYTQKYLLKENSYYYKVMYDALLNDQIDITFFDDFSEKLKKYMREILKYNYNFPLPLYNQFDPNQKNTIAFTHHFFQPNILEENRKIICIPPGVNKYSIEKNIEKDLKKFMSEKNKYYVYISTGGIISQSLSYYISLINSVSKIGNTKIIVSALNNCNSLKCYVEENNLISNVFVGAYLPQKFILSRSNLFITSGGLNSIFESIFFEVPMYVMPITSEQRINSIIVSQLGCGETALTCRGLNNHKISFVVDELLKNPKFSNNSRFYAKKMKEECKNEQWQQEIKNILFE